MLCQCGCGGELPLSKRRKDRPGKYIGDHYNQMLKAKAKVEKEPEFVYKSNVKTNFADKLTDEQKAEIKKRYKPWKRGELAREYGYTRLVFNFILIELGIA